MKRQGIGPGPPDFNSIPNRKEKGVDVAPVERVGVPIGVPIGERQTPRRQQILAIIAAAKGPLSAAQIFQIARRERPRLGLATVYRTLKILQKENTIRFVALPDGGARFETVGRGQHHFQCRVCQEIWTLQSDPLGPLRGAALDGGFVVEDHDTTFYGCCSGCRYSS